MRHNCRVPCQPHKNPYLVLGVSVKASAEEIKSAYRELARQYHPDINPNPAAAERMKEVNAAYSILGDPARRRAYDYESAVSQAKSASQPYTPSSGTRPTYYRPAPTPNPAPNSVNMTGRGMSGWVLISIFMLLNVLARGCQNSIYQPNTHASYYLPGVSAFATPVAEQDIRQQVTPDSRYWEVINAALTEYQLTTSTGLSDEVQRVWLSSSARALVVETKNFGTFYIDEWWSTPTVRSPTIVITTAIP